jgi:hypothetical protein
MPIWEIVEDIRTIQSHLASLEKKLEAIQAVEDAHWVREETERRAAEALSRMPVPAYLA